MFAFRPKRISCSECGSLRVAALLGLVSAFAGLMCAAAVMLRCHQVQPIDEEGLRFVVFDVGQGLAQMACRDGRAIGWDIGDSAHHDAWAEGYGRIGAPMVDVLVISHTHSDHYGGLAYLPPTSSFSGVIATHPYADTALLRAGAGAWRDRLVFRTMVQGDTLGALEGVWVECLWPPDSAGLAAVGMSGADTNRVSLSFAVRYGGTSVLITSDIDTAACRALGNLHGNRLRAEAVVVPHHGSRFSLEAAFYGYVAPETAVISCGTGNSYGHPSPEVERFIAHQSMITLLRTDLHGDITGLSNGGYWVWRSGGEGGAHDRPPE